MSDKELKYAGCSGEDKKSLYPLDEEYPYKDRTKAPGELPHITHYDPFEYSYPYHTHGLVRVGMPEMFIDATSFQAPLPAMILNKVFLLFWLNPHIFEELIYGKGVIVKGTIEIDTDVIPGNSLGSPLMVRTVPSEFLGVRASWYGLDRLCWTGFAQVYIKGDNHVLEDDYFKEQVREDWYGW